MSVAGLYSFICMQSAGDRFARAAHVAGFVGQLELATGGRQFYWPICEINDVALRIY